MSDESNPRRRFMQIAFVVFGVTSLVALIAMVATGIEKVNTGHGLDTYRTSWLVEFNWVGFLVLILGVVVALLGASWFRYREWRELEQLRKRYGSLMTSNNALELSVKHCGPRLAAARSSWPAAQLGRWAS